MAEWQPDPNGISQVVELATMALLPTRYQETLDVCSNLSHFFRFHFLGLLQSWNVPKLHFHIDHYAI